MAYKLGKLPARPGAVTMRFAAFFDAAKLPVPPVKFGHPHMDQPWGMLANDKYGDCVWAGAAHETMVWAREGGYQTPEFRDQDVLSDYSAVTGFDPDNPFSDRGTDMAEAASYRRRTGIVDAAGKRHKVESYLALPVGYPPDLALATYLTGGVGVGLMLPESAEQQFDNQQPWSVVKGSPIVGGHYVNCVGRNSAGDFLIITWKRLHAMTAAFVEKYCDEALAYVSLEAMSAVTMLTPEGFDRQGIERFLARLSTAR